MKALLIGLIFTTSAFAAPSCFQTALRQKGNAYSASTMIVKLSNDLKDKKVEAQISLMQDGTPRQTETIKCSVVDSLANCDSGDGRVTFTVKAKELDNNGSLAMISLQADEIFIMETYTSKDGDEMFDDTSAFGKKIQINQMKTTNCSV